MIISVGYRVNSYRGVQFRQWATIPPSWLKRRLMQNMTSSKSVLPMNSHS